jgi:hypothetical protein
MGHTLTPVTLLIVTGPMLDTKLKASGVIVTRIVVGEPSIPWACALANVIVPLAKSIQ